MSIEILLAVFNGEKYLESQILSLQMQVYKDKMLCVRDGGSCDRSLSIIREAFRKGARYRILDSSGRVSAKENFSELLKNSSSDYVAFCDQDDVWDADKLTLEMAEMQHLEALYPDRPIIVHCDLEVVDATLNTLSPSFFDSQCLPRVHGSVLDQMVQNNVTGCTLLINRAARDLVLPIPPEAIMHDWWIAAKVRYHGGVIGFVDRPLVKYRQHGANVVGARDIDVFYYIRTLFKQWGFIKPWWAIYRQARAIDPDVSLWNIVQRKTVLTFRRLKKRPQA
ncbi:glycosyltransferase family 2 protein [Larsenimonas rhizosphaerae]|uniref:Glycosyltransferase family 2 protein n=1 Tax=Larsenimonas rhizosphaerae TaxID=2944682 RepID=A0AA42CVC4_9GAMM|nr:glycosyltransferase family 2 protein [Larsenimonas rhizosphaerae]MCM2131843.1 glycosyltransferase family 2 protein [Larsenimonas rhizosphaerae]MCX2524841.1 glycosyltransferase family 2 protein [Larsenimonas rhizosphaerae]